MRHIDWDSELSEEDKAWARQAGLIQVEQRIADNEARFGADRSANSLEIPPDPSKSVLDPTQTAANAPTPNAESGDAGAGEGDEVTDDYDNWSKDDLADEINDRNTDPERTKPAIEVTGTGSNGRVLVADMKAALRADDKA